MVIRLTPELLHNAGYTHMTRDQMMEALKDLYTTLELRVGVRLADRLSAPELTQFEKFIDLEQNPEAMRWLSAKIPDYKDEVDDEFDLILRRLSDAAELRSRKVGALRPKTESGLK